MSSAAKRDTVEWLFQHFKRHGLPREVRPSRKLENSRRYFSTHKRLPSVDTGNNALASMIHSVIQVAGVWEVKRALDLYLDARKTRPKPTTELLAWAEDEINRRGGDE